MLPKPSPNAGLLELETPSHDIGYVHMTPREVSLQYYRACVYEAFCSTVLYWTGAVDRGANRWGERHWHYENRTRSPTIR